MASSVNGTILLSFLQLFAQEHANSVKLMEITNSVREEKYFHTLIFISHPRTEEDETSFDLDILSKLVMENLEIPMLQWRKCSTVHLPIEIQRQIFAMVTLVGKKTKDKKTLKALWQSMRRIVTTRILLLTKESGSNEDYLSNIMGYCIENKAIQVLAMETSSNSESKIFEPEIFPKFKLNSYNIEAKPRFLFFKNLYKDMKGQPLNIAIMNRSSRAYSLREVDDQVYMGGYLGHLFTVFAEKHNSFIRKPAATENLPYYFLNSKSLEGLFANRTYDMMAEFSMDILHSNIDFSRIYDLVDLCLMVPVEKPVPLYKLYSITFDPSMIALLFSSTLIFAVLVALTFWIRDSPISLQDILVNVYVFNGLLGQAFPMTRTYAGLRSFVYLLICIHGIIFNTTLVTFLQTMKTSPLMERPIRNLADMEAAHLQFAILKDEYEAQINKTALQDYKHMAYVMANKKEFFTLRNNFYSRYAYVVPSDRWMLYEEQQKYFVRARFRLSKMCFVKIIAVSVPLQANSPFKTTLDAMIRRLNDAGIIKFWKSMAFWEALKMKSLQLRDTSRIYRFKPLALEDIRLLATLFGIILSFNCFCFFMELCWFYRIPLKLPLPKIKSFKGKKYLTWKS
uniref:Ionotropic glutamate receptor C-terminal domain-containing protein n=1 Tax=Stomoxys calcitrans TaxID=35570 RepID=A0A1I8P6K9_STOCA